jgi:hypothetical protein
MKHLAHLPLPLMPLMLMASGCIYPYPVTEVSFEDDGILSFYVFKDPDGAGDYVDPETDGSYIVLPESTVTVRSSTGEALPKAVTDMGDGQWQIDVGPGEVIDLVMAGPSHLPTVRRVQAPTTIAQFSQPMFPRVATVLPPLMDAISEVEGIDFADSSALRAGDVGALVVEPTDPSAWIGADILLTTTDGADIPFVALTITDTGAVGFADGTPVDLLLASSVPAGTFTLAVLTTSGTLTTASWNVAEGELVDGQNFSLATGN